LEKEDGKMKAIICDFGLARISSEKNVISFNFLQFDFSLLFKCFHFF